MADIKNITQRVKFGGSGYLDPKLDAVATMAELNAIDADTLKVGMECTVLNDGSNKTKKYRVKTINGSVVTWESANKYLEDVVDTKADISSLAQKANTATTLGGYGITDAKIDGGVITLGDKTITPLTQHQDISGKADKATTLSGYGITDAVKTVNKINPDSEGNINITTFSDVPSSMDSYKTDTLENYCKAFLTNVNPSQGSAYLTTGIAFTNLPKSFRDKGTPSCELYIYIPMRNENNIVYNLEIVTTNCFDKQWNGVPGKWMGICQVQDGIATLHMPWQGVMTCPQTDSTIGGEHKYIPTKDSDGVSKYWLDTKLADKAYTSAVTDAIATESTSIKSWVEEKGYITGTTEYSAGTNISIDNHVISVTGINIPTKVSELENDEGYLKTHQDISGKQDKLTAGANITIENNVISAVGGGSSVLTSAITTDIAVGHVASGTTYNIGTSIEKILRDIFMTAAPVETYETLNIGFVVAGDGAQLSDLSNMVTTIAYDGVDKDSKTGTTNVSFSIPNGKEYTVKYGNVNGYTKPTNESYTAVGNTTRTLNGKTYTKQVVGEKMYYALVGDTNKLDDYFDGGIIKDGEGGLSYAQNFNENIISSDFITASGIASTNPWTLSIKEDTGIVSILVPIEYKMSEGTNSSVKGKNGNIEIDKDPLPQEITYNGVACKVYSIIYDTGFSQTDTFTITFFENK